MMQISLETLYSLAYNSQVPFVCSCGKSFSIIQKRVKSDLKYNPDKRFYCSRSCAYQGLRNQITVNCAHCQKEFWAQPHDIKIRLNKSNSQKIFCSKSCSNLARVLSSQTCRRISNKLRQNYLESLDSNTNLVMYRGKIMAARTNNVCIVCERKFQYARKLKTCSPECKSRLNKQIGIKGGSATASLPFHKRNRSKNEKLMFELLSKIYTDILHNPRMFDGRDADIVIPSLKLAIHWNGPWHYTPIFGTKLLDDVQEKDKLRYQAIEKAGYRNYIIQDQGKFNPAKVEKELGLLVNFINANPTILS